MINHLSNLTFLEETPYVSKIHRCYKKKKEKGKYYIPFNYKHNVMGEPFPNFPKVNMRFIGKLRKYQIPVVKDCVKILNKKKVLLLSAYTGFGKTISTICLLSKLKRKTLIIVSKLILLTQWKQSIEKFSDIKCQIITSKDKIDKTNDVFIINGININKFKLKFIGVVVVDEIHQMMSEVLYKKVITLEPRYFIGLSATPYRYDGLNKLFEFFCGEENKIVTKKVRDFKVIKTETEFKPYISITHLGKVNWSDVINQQAVNKKRNKLIGDIVAKHKDDYVLVLIKRISIHL